MASDAPPAAPGDNAATQRLRAVERELKDARASLEKARKLNGHLIAQNNKMRGELEDAFLGRKAKRSRRPDADTPILEDMQDY